MSFFIRKNRNMHTLSVHLVTWNGAQYIPYLFDSLRKQTYTDWKLYIWDNGSTDETVAAIEKELSTFSVQYEFIRESQNSGFAGGHNALFKKARAPFLLLLNQDMYVTPTCFEHMVAFLTKHEMAAAVSPRLMRWNIDTLKSGAPLAQSFSEIIDALGLRVFRSRRVIEKYTGKSWNSVKAKMHMSHRVIDGDAMEVFGVSGAFPLLRRAAVEHVVFPDGTMFDETYHAYKEDVDLAFRLRAAGFSSYVLLESVAYHDRSAAGPEEFSDRAALKNKKDQSDWVKKHSYKNHLMTLYKNEYWQNVLLDFPYIVWYECKKLIYFLLFDRAVLGAARDIWKHRRALRERRRHIVENRQVSFKQIRQWWVH
jgi:GT2 family glycosyltransferase